MTKVMAGAEQHYFWKVLDVGDPGGGRSGALDSQASDKPKN